MKISILIPAYNEEKTIRKTIQTCLAQTRKPDEIIVINDGSTDNTLKILKRFGKSLRVITLKHNTGNKSLAQEQGLKYVTGDIVITTDADTLLHPQFLENILPCFKNPKVAAAGGYVKSLKNNWLTAAREIDYIVGQNIYKNAQSLIGFIFVIPGCAAAYRTEVIKEHVRFEHDTVTEDLDFTLQIHQLGYRIDFATKAIAYTQDPFNLSSYIRQMRRWYGGGWENLLKHYPLLYHDPRAAFELSAIFVDGLVFSILFIVQPLINFPFFLKSMLYFFLPQAVVFCLYAAWKSRRLDLAWQPLGYVLTRFLNAIIFMEQFFKVIVLRQRQTKWLKADRLFIR